MESTQSLNHPIRDFQLAEKILEAAKLDKNDYLPTILSIFIGNDVSNDDLKLMEVDEENLKYLLDGNSLIVRGGEDENAFCCSQNKTYSFKVAEISNPLLITQNIIYPEQINKNEQSHIEYAEIKFISSTYFEMKLAKPKLEKLKYLLELNFYSGPTNEKNYLNAKKYTIDDFLDLIQASEDEIYKYLNYIEAFNINGYWRLLDFDYLTGIIENIMRLIEDNSWLDDQIPLEELYTDLQDLYSLSILKQMAKYYFVQNESNPKLHELKTSKICRLYAEIILKKMLRMRLHEFEEIWKNCVPKYKTELSMLDGLAYIEDHFIYYLNLHDLPDDVENRLKFLFEKRKKWPLNDIKVYISDICADESEINSLLAKNCRSFNQNGVKYFSSRMN